MVLQIVYQSNLIDLGKKVPIEKNKYIPRSDFKKKIILLIFGEIWAFLYEIFGDLFNIKTILITLNGEKLTNKTKTKEKVKKILVLKS